jgi:hypothetical protein
MDDAFAFRVQGFDLGKALFEASPLSVAVQQNGACVPAKYQEKLPAKADQLSGALSLKKRPEVPLACFVGYLEIPVGLWRIGKRRPDARC